MRDASIFSSGGRIRWGGDTLLVISWYVFVSERNRDKRVGDKLMIFFVFVFGEMIHITCRGIKTVA